MKKDFHRFKNEEEANYEQIRQNFVHEKTGSQSNNQKLFETLDGTRVPQLEAYVQSHLNKLANHQKVKNY